MLDKPWIFGILYDKQDRYRPVTNCTYWTLLGPFKNSKIIQLSHKSNPFDKFYEIHRVFLDGISDNMVSLVESGKYGIINTTDTTTNVFYVIMFTSEAYTLQDNKTIDWKIITSGKLVVKAQYLCSMKLDTNWYWNQHPQHHVITVTTYTILHPWLEVNSITDIHGITKSVCNRTQVNKSISRHPICLTDSDYDYILEESSPWCKIEFERDVEIYS